MSVHVAVSGSDATSTSVAGAASVAVATGCDSLPRATLDLDLDRLADEGIDCDRTSLATGDVDSSRLLAGRAGTSGGVGGDGNCAPRLDSSSNVNVAAVLSESSPAAMANALESRTVAEKGGGGVASVVTVDDVAGVAERVEMGDGTCGRSLRGGEVGNEAIGTSIGSKSLADKVGDS